MSTATADAIIEQLGRSTGNMVRMIGAHTFTAGEHSLTFKFKAPGEERRQLRPHHAGFLRHLPRRVH